MVKPPKIGGKSHLVGPSIHPRTGWTFLSVAHPPASHPGKGWEKGRAEVRAGLALPSRSSARTHLPGRAGVLRGRPRARGAAAGSAPAAAAPERLRGAIPGRRAGRQEGKENPGVAHSRLIQRPDSGAEGTEGTRLVAGGRGDSDGGGEEKGTGVVARERGQ